MSELSYGYGLSSAVIDDQRRHNRLIAAQLDTLIGKELFIARRKIQAKMNRYLIQKWRKHRGIRRPRFCGGK
jgi:hypothetical protein